MIKDILNEIKNRFGKNNNVISLTLVGSFSNSDKKLEKFNDIDLVFVLDKVNKKEITYFHEFGLELADKFSNNKVGITHTLKIGPIKEKSNKQKTIMLHFLVYSRDTYFQESKVARFTWQHYKPLLGKSLLEFNKINKIIKTDLFNDVDGIPAMKRWIKTGLGEYIEPIGEKTSVVSLKLEGTLYLEVIFYSVLILITNMLRVKGTYLDVNKKICEEFKKVYNIPLKDWPQKVLSLKKKLRKGRTFSKKEVIEIKAISLEFIKQCEDVLNKYELIER